MSNVPNEMTIELDENDVNEDLVKLINDMSKMRQETIKNRVMTPEQKDEYLHMAYRLASGLEATADEAMTNKMRLVAETLNRNHELVGYDPMQDLYWRKNESRFSETLEDMLIGIVKDDFHDADAKHHVFQAVKYLTIKDSSAKEREEVFDTMLPFCEPLEIKKDSLIKRITATLFGSRHNFERLENLTLQVEATDGFSEELLDIARERGYTTLQLLVPGSEVDKISEVIGTNNVSNLGTIPDFKSKGFVNDLIKKTRLISYPLLGALPRRIQERLEDRFEDYKSEFAFEYSSLGEGFLGFAGGIAGGITALCMGRWDIAASIPIGIGIMADGFIRNYHGCDEDTKNFDHPVGSFFLKPFFYLFEPGKKDEKYFRLNVSLRESGSSGYIPNPIKLYTKLGKIKSPDGLEDNLIWSTTNHHRFGKEFLSYLESKEGKMPKGLSVTKDIDKLNQAVIYNHGLQVNGFRKHSALFCFKDRRYIVTSIDRSEKDTTFLHNTAKILHEGFSTQDSFTKLGEESKSRYLHLIEYQKGEMVNELEGVN